MLNFRKIPNFCIFSLFGPAAPLPPLAGAGPRLRASPGRGLGGQFLVKRDFLVKMQLLCKKVTFLVKSHFFGKNHFFGKKSLFWFSAPKSLKIAWVL